VGKHDYTKMDQARDELMSHVVRCDVLEAEMEHRAEWLQETMDYMAERYPMLSDLQLTQLEMMGRQFIKPAIPHGQGHTSRTRDNNIEELVEEEVNEALATEVEATETPDSVDAPESVEATEAAEASADESDASEPELQTA